MSGFVDEAQLHVKAGDGGAGSVSFRREAHVAKGGPDGGDGGDGGDVWLVADRNTASLYGFRDHPHRRAANGTHGAGKGRHGKGGADLEVPVPEGTVIKDLDGKVLADLTTEGDRWLAGKGGQGGKGNARFLSNRRRAPAFAEQAELGEEHWYNMELRLMADVALVGFPNAGKSTLISRISAAKPKIADYPFTTLEPHLGVVRFEEHEFVVADIPGLIEGASEGKGLGHRFLRHIERARAMVVLVDLTAADGRSPDEQERILVEELRRYRPELAERPRIVIGSKLDAAPPDAPGPDMRISALTGEGLRPLLGALSQLVAGARSGESRPRRFVVHRPAPVGVVVERGMDGGWEVTGRPALRAVALSDLTNVEALAYAQGRLKSLGVDKALAKAGARSGDRVRIGGFEFDYEPD
ncbi:GTPase ObgE [Acidiferrimicrobium sp. IK]|uniref:GTPase ObgE n=1 Tax=Acidiferrimicrobium sp. IK TaxID=2871700 RepID=UPI0021CB5BD6|nr:GTPase ObgE [Acidiferrimicrobium sp. IK]MCU4185493.1 GTPase ObgE [Acidiferrimicrobium sp. IK]